MSEETITASVAVDSKPCDSHDHEELETSPLIGDEESILTSHAKRSDSADHSTTDDIAKHNDVLSATKTLMDKLIYLGIFTSFMYASRTNIQVLYARTFSNDIQLITYVIFFFFLITSIADSYRFDFR